MFENFGQTPNYINVPMYRKGIEDKLLRGERIWLVTCVDSSHTDRHIQFQVISPKPIAKLDSKIHQIIEGVFYGKYRYTPDDMTTIKDEITNIDDVDTSILLTVR